MTVMSLMLSYWNRHPGLRNHEKRILASLPHRAVLAVTDALDSDDARNLEEACAAVTAELLIRFGWEEHPAQLDEDSGYVLMATADLGLWLAHDTRVLPVAYLYATVDRRGFFLRSYLDGLLFGSQGKAWGPDLQHTFLTVRRGLDYEHSEHGPYTMFWNARWADIRNIVMETPQGEEGRS